ncbi:MAG: hypothetical protein JETCAE03_31370 [Ignavibacteriaceae bacterium]|nr:MAG: hypothetical protein BroJett017_29430 [Ignavibacteriota bacterium]GJQ43639.1 MAG: hypothetical protein JETCAE03_31370 [Ignavibacteriaceae bacterium]
MSLKSSAGIFLLALLFVTEAFSLPRFAVRLGDKCIDCHYNPTGGMMRNEDGWNFGKNIMSAITPRDQDFATTPKIADNISFGLDYRTQFLYSEQKDRTDFQQMTGSIYTNVGLAKNINLLGRYDFINEVWEAYGVAQILPNNSYIKVGSFIPNYGIRIDDHTAYTRGGDMFLLSTNGNQGLIYTPYYTEAGVEAGLYISNWGLFTASAGSNLANNFTLSKDPTYTTRIELFPKIGRAGLMFGGSYAAAKIPHSADFYGGFVGFGLDRFSLLSEFDLGNNVITNGTKSNFAMAEAAYVITMGIEAVVRYDRIDPNIDVGKNEIQRVIVGFEWFPYAFIEIRPQYRFIIEEPSQKNNSAVIQFHFWY